MPTKFFLSTLLFSCLAATGFSQTVLPLYTGKIPNSKPAENIETSTTDKNGFVIVRNISIPTLTVFLPEKKKANGTAVIICPGGGYWVAAIKHEGTDVAKEFVARGTAAFVLKYRIPDERTMQNTGIGPLQDAEQAMLMVKSRAYEWQIDTAKIGVMGFSAGGHLASTLATQYLNVVIDNPMNFSLRPAFQILVYPVITVDSSINPRGLIEKLVGKKASSVLWERFSNEKQVTAETPAAFITQATDDELSVRNSLLYYEALLRAKVPVEMHLYRGGGHGYGLHNKTSSDKWLERCFNWMKDEGWMKMK